MESPSQAPHSGGSLWKGLLLTASFLSCWIQQTTAQTASITVVPNPSYGTVGGSVSLEVLGFSEQPPKYTWYKSTVDNSHQIASYVTSTGEVTTIESRLDVLSNGSLIIRDLILSDTDDYIVEGVDPTSLDILRAQGHLTVYEIVSKPNITANSTNVIENATLFFTCNTEHEGINILWFFNNESLSLNERKYLRENNQTLIIENVTREDAGSYQCEVWNPISAKRSDSLELTVNYGPDYIVFSLSPVGDEIQVTFAEQLNLVCQVDSYPPAQYEWQVNDTVISNLTDNTYTVSNVSWEDSGKYTCLAWNNVTNLSVSKTVTITVVAEKSSEGGNGSSLSAGAIAGIVIGVLAGVALIGALIYFLFFRNAGG